jgi:hypothetical protein
MFYRLLGMAVWKFASAYIRANYGRRLKAAAVFGLLSVAVGGYLAARNGD